jgi:hypothetical protein
MPTMAVAAATIVVVAAHPTIWVQSKTVRSITSRRRLDDIRMVTLRFAVPHRSPDRTVERHRIQRQIITGWTGQGKHYEVDATTPQVRQTRALNTGSAILG